MKTRLLCLTLLIVQHVYSQQATAQAIRARVVDSLTSLPLPFVKVANLKTKKAVLSDVDGWFEWPDTLTTALQFSSPGYKTREFPAAAILDSNLVRLPENAESLEEYILLADDQFLYELMGSVFTRRDSTKAEAKTYFQLSTFLNGTQVELIESYYNGRYENYNIRSLQYKEGRSAVAMENNTSFFSQETASAVLQLQLDRENEFLPAVPFAYPARRMKKHFSTVLNKITKSDQGHTIYIISFDPVSNPQNYFSGTAWIDSNDRVLQRLVLRCENTTVHPFLPLWQEDSILSVSFDLNYVFGPRAIDHVYFDYALTYQNRNKQRYSVQSNVLVYPYAYGDHFLPPVFDSPGTRYSDHRKLIAYPFNRQFWETAERPVSMEEALRNEFFFNDPAILMNSEGIVDSGYFTNGVYESPYTPWQPRRIGFLRLPQQQKELSMFSIRPNTLLYNLSGKIYADIHTWNGKTLVLSRTLLDPYETFYSLPVDNTTNCFLNLYLDLIEIERRKFEQQLSERDHTPEEALALLAATNEKAKAMTARFLKEVAHGSNYRGMEKWNAFVLQSLGIDNFKFFGLYRK